MVAEIITRALLEHYLRATGWAWVDWPPTNGKAWKHPQFNEDFSAVDEHHLNDADFMSALIVIGRKERCTALNVNARLGLCAAAEMALLEGDEGLVRDLLRAAGVDPDRWEEARAAAGDTTALAPAPSPPPPSLNVQPGSIIRHTDGCRARVIEIDQFGHAHLERIRKDNQPDKRVGSGVGFLSCRPQARTI